MYPPSKRRGKERFHVVSTWNTFCVFVGYKKIWTYLCRYQYGSKINHLENCIANILKNLNISTSTAYLKLGCLLMCASRKAFQKSYEFMVRHHYGIIYVVMKIFVMIIHDYTWSQIHIKEYTTKLHVTKKN